MFDLIVRTCPKAGNSAAQNEDAAAAAPKAGRAAVADGASEGWQSGAWAKALATAYAKSPPDPAGYGDWLTAARSGPDVPQLASTGGSWYAEAKATQGAFATLLGVSFEPPKTGPGLKWRAVAVGDSCLFHVRGGKLLTAFPVEDPGGFGNRPALVGSSPLSPVAEPQWFAGRAEPGDTFFLLTDALAEWCLTAAASNAGPWAALEAAADGFAVWVQSLRDAKTIKNDDTTTVLIAVKSAK